MRWIGGLFRPSPALSLSTLKAERLIRRNSEEDQSGASLTPSPVIATISPLALKASTRLSFCSGNSLAKIFVCENCLRN